MARQTVTSLVDDLDGSTAESTVSFSIDGVAYEIDLSKKNATALGKSLAPFVSAGRKISGRRGGRSSGARAKTEQTQAVRHWARENGYEISDRGRIPAGIQEAYNAS